MLERRTSETETESFPAELLIWLSPVFPVGGFAYSQGLEAAVARGAVSDVETLLGWLLGITRHGSLRNDLIILTLTRLAPDADALGSVAELAAALQPSRERAEETLVQGQAFLEAYEAAWADNAKAPGPALPDGRRVALPVAVGLCSRAYQFDCLATLTAFGAAFHANLVSAAIRLGVIGQFDGQRVLAQLLPDLRKVCNFALTAHEDDLGAASFAADLASIHHETQKVRLFRS